MLPFLMRVSAPDGVGEGWSRRVLPTLCEEFHRTKEPPLGKEAALFIPFLQSPHPEGPRFKSGVCS